jgi:hypothetical protein
MDEPPGLDDDIRTHLASNVLGSVVGLLTPQSIKVFRLEPLQGVEHHRDIRRTLDTERKMLERRQIFQKRVRGIYCLFNDAIEAIGLVATNNFAFAKDTPNIN